MGGFNPFYQRNAKQSIATLATIYLIHINNRLDTNIVILSNRMLLLHRHQQSVVVVASHVAGFSGLLLHVFVGVKAVVSVASNDGNAQAIAVRVAQVALVAVAQIFYLHPVYLKDNIKEMIQKFQKIETII